MEAKLAQIIEDLLDRYLINRNFSKSLINFEYQVFSQSGEDGIISEIFERIGVKSKVFVEFGVGDGLENNTAALLMNKWSGLWIEGSKDSCEAISAGLKGVIASGNLQLENSYVTSENIENLLKKRKIPSEFDLLSIDIDSCDYWVWKSIKHYQPRVVVIEYNATMGPKLDWVMKYDPNHKWDESSNYGASLKALELLGRDKGYSLVGCSFSGVNAFFVRSDLIVRKFKGPFTAFEHFQPARYSYICKRGHRRSYEMFTHGSHELN